MFQSAMRLSSEPNGRGEPVMMTASPTSVRAKSFAMSEGSVQGDECSRAPKALRPVVDGLWVDPVPGARDVGGGFYLEGVGDGFPLVHGPVEGDHQGVGDADPGAVGRGDGGDQQSLGVG